MAFQTESFRHLEIIIVTSQNIENEKKCTYNVCNTQRHSNNTTSTTDSHERFQQTGRTTVMSKMEQCGGTEDIPAWGSLGKVKLFLCLTN
jgi:hypothetical protein